MTKSRKKRGGYTEPVSACGQPGMEGLCPQQTSTGSSLMATTKAGIKLTNQNSKNQSAMNSAMAKGGGKRKKRGGGGISAGKNMCTGTKHSLQQHASSTYDSQAKSLNINPPCDPFSGNCPSSGGGKKKRRRKKRRRTRKKTRRRKRKTRRRRKSRKRRS